MMTYEEACRFFDYNPETGSLKWKESPSQKIRIGDEVGTLALGYRKTCFRYKQYQIHRIIWLIVTGSWPAGQIDHINERKDDNRFCNLRDCTAAQNRANRSVSVKSSSGFKGVTWSAITRKWQVTVRVKGKTQYFGVFLNKEEANLVAISARKQLHGEFANHG